MYFVLGFFILSMMVNINIGTININGALFSVVLVQETHCEGGKEGTWKKEWSGQLLLSHKRPSSAGVGILFSKAFTPQSVETQDIMAGHAILVKTLFEDKRLFLL